MGIPGARVRREVAVAKVPAALEHIRDILDGSEGSKLVVMAHHHEVVDALASGLKDYGVVVLTGETKMDDRDAYVALFQNDPGTASSSAPSRRPASA